MFRDRTNLYLSYRRTFPRFNIPTNLPDSTNTTAKEEGIPMLDVVDSLKQDSSTLSSPSNEQLTMITENILKPIDEKLNTIDDLIDNRLLRLYKKVMLPGFQDRTSDIDQIEELNFQIIKYLQICSQSVQLLSQENESGSVHNNNNNNNGITIILVNLGKAYARKIQIKSTKFRLLQNNYLKFLNNDDFKPLPTASDKSSSHNEESNTLLDIDDNDDDLLLLEQEEQQQRGQLLHHTSNFSTKYLQQRDEEITQLAKGVLEVSSIFKELQQLIIDQGTVIDRIDYNLEMTASNLVHAQKELNTATVYQKKEGKCKVVFLLILLVLCLFFFIMLRPGSSSKTVVEKHKEFIVEQPQQVQEQTQEQEQLSPQELY
ncbi:t-SNARE syntaxin TLG2 SCDLUD_003396 [Saccharomycodes ludwigii]|uniref:t-SNARE syntaxin TLG2 n=1 Tax=Saccharomycodes ludwigii TaxID=36035 RepID=UPI001E8463DF|nr:hypothetical protein SCDLUD_003396 [Saccharomycodes ludwigii]KAH3900417.1 hypothetical protein SCDLUD_003396 [Saccharomycodes ludwigii]